MTESIHPTMMKIEPRDVARLRIVAIDQNHGFDQSLGTVYGLDGYELVAIVHDNVPMQVPDEGATHDSGPRPTKLAFVRRALFVLEQKKDTALEEAEARRAEASSMLYEVQSQRAALGHRVSELETELRKEKLEKSDARMELDRMSVDGMAAHERANKLERDLSRVQQALGDLRWKEILGSHP